MLKRVVVAAGVVVNVNDEPPLEVAKDVEATGLTAEKSFATPVVAPLVPMTDIVQTTGNPTRIGAVLVQLRIEAVVGLPKTTNDSDPPVTTEFPRFDLTTTE